MKQLVTVMIEQCYGVALCVLTVLLFLFVNRKYRRKEASFFYLLSFQVLLLSFAGTVERFLGEWKYDLSLYQVRNILRCLYNITAPAILLTFLEIPLREEKKWVKWGVALPEFLYILLVMTSFFRGRSGLHNNGYSGAEFIPVQYIMLLYLLIMMAFILCRSRKRKREFIILLLISSILMLNGINEMFRLLPVHTSEITIAVSMLAYLLYFSSKQHLNEVDKISHDYADNEAKHEKELVDQSIETLAYTIDAKDTYTKGHSVRVARYSKMIAKLLGKSEEECRKVYLAGLLHDIGKISISDNIINKNGRLSKEEFANIKKHSENGAKILEKMKQIPYIQNGARFHHERYDGTGYPLGLKGEEIPELARIIAVADAYDAMTSNRSYRKAMDQAMVKQEIWKGMGTQFDPLYCKLMISLIDADNNYEMRERTDIEDEIRFDGKEKEIVWSFHVPKEIGADHAILQNTDLDSLGAFVVLEERWSNPTDAVRVLESPVMIRFQGKTRVAAQYLWCVPTVIVFAAEDGKVNGKHYDELAVFICSGYGWRASSSIIEETKMVKNSGFDTWEQWMQRNKEGLYYVVSARREKDCVLVSIRNELITLEARVLLSADDTRDIYISFTGEQCDIQDMVVE